MKVGIVAPSLPQVGQKPGGVEIVVHELANAVSRAGHSVRVFSHSPKPPDALYEIASIPMDVSSTSFARMFILPFKMSSFNLADLDVLHLNGDDWAFWQRGLPTVRTFHGCSLNEARYADHWRQKVLFYVYHPLEKLANRLADVSTGVGDDTVPLLRARYVIPNGFESQFFYRESKSDKPTAIVIGTLNGRKQTRLAIEMLLSLRETFTELTIDAVIDQPYEHPAVRSWIGITREQLARLVRKAWIGVSTTKYEGFGIYYLEWMAAGTVPVSFSNIGTGELIRSQKAGVLVEDLVHMRESVAELLRDHELRNRYAEAGIKAAEGLNWDRIAEQYLQVYTEAIDLFCKK